MKRLLLPSALTFVGALALAPSVSRADPVERPEAGDLSLSFGVPSGGNDYAAGAAGLWWMASDSLNLGFNLGLGVNFDQDNAVDVLLAPALRYYFLKADRVSPFLLGQMNLRIFENGPDADLNFGLLTGLGAEVWLISELSLAGYVGMGFDLYQGEGGSASIGTLTSGLTLNLYFDFADGDG
jgi:hypothetical protein